MSDQQKLVVERLNEAAARVVAGLRAQSPGIADGYLFRVLATATGMLMADHAFPEMPSEEMYVGAGHLMGHGVHIAVDARMQFEKQTCKGAA